MKKKDINGLVFKKQTVIELNDSDLLMVNGGTNTSQACVVVAVSVFSVASVAVSLAFEFGLLEGAADAIATKQK